MNYIDVCGVDQFVHFSCVTEALNGLSRLLSIHFQLVFANFYSMKYKHEIARCAI